MMKASTPETRKAALDKGLESLRIEGSVFKHDDIFNSLKDSSISGEVTIDGILSILDQMYCHTTGARIHRYSISR
jgi:hypothetical protein